MRICVATPAPPRSRAGNRVTALRWARLLQDLGHRVTVATAYRGQPCDLLVALHAHRSFDSIARFRDHRPEAPLIVALTGTDLYGSLGDPLVQRALDLASRLVLLQPQGLAELPPHVRSKAAVIYQSARVPAGSPPRRGKTFRVLVLGHLRPVKDPFRTAEAARLLPASSRIAVLHAGAALTPEMDERARAEAQANPRYRWLGDVPRWRALRLLARSHLLVHSSHMEGGANAISEALAASVPILASRIPGSVGLLGDDYPGYFPVGDTAALARLLLQAETDGEFYEALRARCAALRPLVDPARERASWETLLREIGAPGGGARGK